ncbi:Haloacid dehalogenase-like hydrolase domain-containing protein 2 [Orchesella cincta]|uniref:Haloacid dehalogenase-like hydrolase domain-containing protein 2 n=1 Tax=Orchesella cincta TaxID=48709 RepID=A0A1D2MRV8_ORCCI|nr:Haloacid dehalogenase-like hydrolase domain-containing protein 2 [Orchesella cincta]
MQSSSYSNKKGLVVRRPDGIRGVNEYLNNITVNEWGRSSIDRFLINLSGTTHDGNKLLEGSARAYAKLKMRNKKFRYLNGSSSESSSTTLKHLASIGFGILKQELYTAVTSTRDYLQAKNLRPHLVVTDDALQDFAGINTMHPNVVVIGYAPEKFNYETFAVCFQKIITMPGKHAKLIAIDMGRLRDTTQRWCFENDQYESVAAKNVLKTDQQCQKYEQDVYRAGADPDVGTGPFVKGLAHACLEDDITVVGKPSNEYYWNAMFSLGEEYPINCVVIGDDVDNDVIAAINAGMHGCLVKTGKYRLGDENKLFTTGFPPVTLPVKDRCLVVDSVEEAIDKLTQAYYTVDSSKGEKGLPLKVEVWGREFEFYRVGN